MVSPCAAINSNLFMFTIDGGAAEMRVFSRAEISGAGKTEQVKVVIEVLFHVERRKL